MARRTTSKAVQGVLIGDYNGKSDLLPFIASASVLVDRVATLAAKRTVTLTSTELELIERWLAAHFYCCSDQPLSSKSTQGASGNYQGQTSMNLKGTKYGQTAIMLDFSGTLEAISERKIAKGFWVGTTAEEEPTLSDTGPGNEPY